MSQRRRECRVFLDANVLFSAAYRQQAGLQIFWKLRDVRLITSWYAAQEAANNLAEEDQQLRLRTLLEGVEMVAEGSDVGSVAGLWSEIILPDKDRPIFAAALAAKSDFLLTGDVRHFGMYFDKEVRGIRILRPAEFLQWFQASDR
jgi:predicted nucleic acid-binding protein